MFVAMLELGGMEDYMTELRIRNVDEWVVEFHRRYSKMASQTLEATLRNALIDSVLEKRRKMAEEIEPIFNRLLKEHGELPSSVEAIREFREGIG